MLQKPFTVVYKGLAVFVAVKKGNAPKGLDMFFCCLTVFVAVTMGNASKACGSVFLHFNYFGPLRCPTWTPCCCCFPSGAFCVTSTCHPWSPKFLFQQLWFKGGRGEVSTSWSMRVCTSNLWRVGTQKRGQIWEGKPASTWWPLGV